MTVEVGDAFPFPGVRINLDAVALAMDSRLLRRNLEDPKGPSSVEAEWAPDAVLAGNFIFCSGFPDFTSGLAVRKPSGVPYYGRTWTRSGVAACQLLQRAALWGSRAVSFRVRRLHRTLLRLSQVRSMRKENRAQESPGIPNSGRSISPPLSQWGRGAFLPAKSQLTTTRLCP
jgi:hypothetical protein